MSCSNYSFRCNKSLKNLHVLECYNSSKFVYDIDGDLYIGIIKFKKRYRKIDLDKNIEWTTIKEYPERYKFYDKKVRTIFNKVVGLKPIKTNDLSINKGGLRVFDKRHLKPNGYLNILIASTSKKWKPLSPFIIKYENKIVENIWQFSKVYDIVEKTNEPSLEHFSRYNMNITNDSWDKKLKLKKKVFYHIYKNRKLSIIAARIILYCPIYSYAVKGHNLYKELSEIYNTVDELGLVGFYGWDHIAQGFGLDDVVEFTNPTFGHIFVIAGLLESNEFWLTKRVLIFTNKHMFLDKEYEETCFEDDIIDDILSFKENCYQIGIYNNKEKVLSISRKIDVFGYRVLIDIF